MLAQSFSRENYDFKTITVVFHISTLNACSKHDLGQEKWAYLKERLVKEMQYT